MSSLPHPAQQYLAGRRCRVAMADPASRLCHYRVLATNRTGRLQAFPCRSVSDGSSDLQAGRALSLAELRARLGEAVKGEDYLTAAKLRDTMQCMEVDTRLAVEDANKRFYEALAAGSFKAMDAVWGHGPHVQALYPSLIICVSGRDAVMQSWRMILASMRPRAFRIVLEDVRIHATETYGFVTCIEVFETDDSASSRTHATNVFEKQAGGQWAMVLHRGGGHQVDAYPARPHHTSAHPQNGS